MSNQFFHLSANKRRKHWSRSFGNVKETEKVRVPKKMEKEAGREEK